jgi:hypothetical protein
MEFSVVQMQNGCRLFAMGFPEKRYSGDICVPREAFALLSNERLILRETNRAVTPFGGVAVFIVYLRKVEFVEKVR